jgi:alpha-galactosidase
VVIISKKNISQGKRLKTIAVVIIFMLSSFAGTFGVGAIGNNPDIVGAVVEDSTHIIMTFDSAVSWQTANPQWYVFASDTPNPSLQGDSFQIAATSVTAVSGSNNTKWRVALAFALPAEKAGVIRIVEAAVDSNNDISGVLKDSANTYGVEANYPSTVGYDVTAISYNPSLTSVEIKDDLHLVLNFSQDIFWTVGEANAINYIFASDVPNPNPGVNGSWQIPVKMLSKISDSKWEIMLESPLDRDKTGVVRIVEDSVDSNSTLSAIVRDSTNAVGVSANNPSDTGYDVTAQNYSIPTGNGPALSGAVIEDSSHIRATFSDEIKLTDMDTVSSCFKLVSDPTNPSWTINAANVRKIDSNVLRITLQSNIPYNQSGYLKITESGIDNDNVIKNPITDITGLIGMQSTYGSLSQSDYAAVAYSFPSAPQLISANVEDATHIVVKFDKGVKFANNINPLSYVYISNNSNPNPPYNGDWQVGVSVITGINDSTFRLTLSSPIEYGKTGVVRISEMNVDGDNYLSNVITDTSGLIGVVANSPSSVGWDVGYIGYTLPGNPTLASCVFEDTLTAIIKFSGPIEFKDTNPTHHFFVSNNANPNPPNNGDWQIGVSGMSKIDDCTYRIVLAAPIDMDKRTGVFRMSENDTSPDSDNVVSNIATDVSGIVGVSSNYPSDVGYDVAAVDFVPVAIPAIERATVVDSTHIQMKFTSAVKFASGINPSSCVFVSDVPFPNPGMGGSWQIGVSSMTTSDNITWSVVLNSPISLNASGVIRIVEYTREDTDNNIGQIMTSYDGKVNVDSNYSCYPGYDVSAVSYILPNQPVLTSAQITSVDISNSKTYAQMKFSNDVTLAQNISSYIFLSSSPTPASNYCYAISVSQVDARTYNVTFSGVLTASQTGVLRIDEGIVDNTDYISVVKDISGTMALKSTNPSSSGYDVAAVTYTFPDNPKLISAYVEDSTHIVMEFDKGVSFGVTPSNCVYASDIPNPNPGVNGSWQINTSSVAVIPGTNDTKYRATLSTALTSSNYFGYIRISEYIGSPDTDDNIERVVKDSSGLKGVKATDPSASGHDVAAVRYNPMLKEAYIKDSLAVVAKFTDNVSLYSSIHNHAFVASNFNPDLAMAGNWQIACSSTTNIDGTTRQFNLSSPLDTIGQKGVFRLSDGQVDTDLGLGNIVNNSALSIPAFARYNSTTGYDVDYVELKTRPQLINAYRLDSRKIVMEFNQSVTLSTNAYQAFFVSNSPTPNPPYNGDWQISLSSITKVADNIYIANLTSDHNNSSLGVIRICEAQVDNNDGVGTIATGIDGYSSVVANVPSDVGYDVAYTNIIDKPTLERATLIDSKTVRLTFCSAVVLKDETEALRNIKVSQKPFPNLAVSGDWTRDITAINKINDYTYDVSLSSSFSGNGYIRIQEGQKGDSDDVISDVFSDTSGGMGILANYTDTTGYDVCSILIESYDSSIIDSTGVDVFDGEMIKAHNWFETAFNTSASSRKIPFDFNYGSSSFSSVCNTTAWTCSVSADTYANSKRERIITWTENAANIQVKVKAYEYLNFPAVEWTVYIKNNGGSSSNSFTNINAITETITKAQNSSNFKLNYNVGCSYNYTDPETGYNEFRPVADVLDPSTTKTLATFGGRSSYSYLPYFNLEYANGNEGRIISLGWPGQWSANFSTDAINNITITGGQETTSTTLNSGEEIRTPMMDMLFWEKDRERSQNIFRRWVIKNNMPTDDGMPIKPELTNATITTDLMQKATVYNQKNAINRLFDESLNVSNWLMDAGWYPRIDNPWSDSMYDDWMITGTWDVDTAKFPDVSGGSNNGIKPISDYAHSLGLKSTLWMELERVIALPGSHYFDSHSNWLLTPPETGTGYDASCRLLNLGNSSARADALNTINTILQNNKINIYRQDFNIDPLRFWNKADTTETRGKTENLYIDGYLKLWDGILQNNPSIYIDNCASGGRRLDLETVRRSVCLFRTDYVWHVLPAQLQQYGISSWIPYTGVGTISPDLLTSSYKNSYGQTVDDLERYFYSETNDNDIKYIFRSQMSPSMIIAWNLTDHNNSKYPLLRSLVDQYNEVKDYYMGDYYQLTGSPYGESNYYDSTYTDSYGRTQTDEEKRWMAWQYHDTSSDKGMIQAFRRHDCEISTLTVKLSGLDKNKNYRIIDVDNGSVLTTMPGADLMNTGYTITSENASYAALLKYETVTGIAGDINNDGMVSIHDLVMVKNHLLKLTIFSSQDTQTADIDKNGKVTIFDMLQIKKHILGLINIT